MNPGEFTWRYSQEQFFVALAIWFFAIWRSYEERRRHPPRH
jgi:hypothetical protein